MERTFTTHRVRRTESLDGIWDFRMEGFDTQYRLPVPAVWEQHPDFLAHRGHGTYTRRVCVSEAGNLRLVTSLMLFKNKNIGPLGDISANASIHDSRLDIYPFLLDVDRYQLALSGIYTAAYGFGGYSDELVYLNSPVDYLANMPADHPYIQEYNRHRGIIVVGQGPWEEKDTTFRLRDICQQKGIGVWFDIWGYDARHDWDWWYKQVEYHVPHLLD